MTQIIHNARPILLPQYWAVDKTWHFILHICEHIFLQERRRKISECKVSETLTKVIDVWGVKCLFLETLFGEFCIRGQGRGRGPFSRYCCKYLYKSFYWYQYWICRTCMTIGPWLLTNIMTKTWLAFIIGLW